MGQKPNLKGLAPLRREFDRLTDLVTDAAIDGVGKGLAILEAGMRRRAPRGETGELVASIHATTPRAAKGFVGGAVVVSSDHAAAVEFGTTHEAAQPFVRPTADIDGGRALAVVSATIEARLR